MAKKNFKNSARESVASAFFSTLDTEDTQNTEATEARWDLPETQDSNLKSAKEISDSRENKRTSIKNELPPYRINLKLKGEYKEYLDQVSWENRTSITAYLNDLIEQDRKKYTKKG